MKYFGLIFMLITLLSGSCVVFSQDDVRGLKSVGSKVPVIETEEVDVQPLQQVLPAIRESKKDSDTLSSKTKIYLKQINLSGNTIFSADELKTLISPYLNRYVSIDELQQLRHELTRFYIVKGYVSSGVVLPDQKITDGTIKYEVVEGRLSGLTIKGNKGLNSDYITQRIKIDKDQPLNIIDIRNNLKMLQRNNLINQINAVLEPASKAGESVLVMEIVEAKSSMFAVNFDNYNPPSVGAERLSVNYENYNLTGSGDSLFLNAGATQGVNDFAVNYTYQLSAKNDSLSFYYALNDSIVVEEPFSAIDLEGQSVLSGILYTRPFFETLNTSHKMLLGFETDESQNRILGVPVAFDPGADVITGISKTAVLQLGYDYIQRNKGSILTWRAMLRYGLDVADSTINENSLPDSQFTSLRAQLQFANKFDFLQSQLFLRSSLQYSNDALLFIEKFVVGGFGSVRGYRENQAIRDNGILASLEWQIPLSYNAQGVNTNTLKLIPYFDTGYAADHDETLSQTESVSLSSVGVGLNWDPMREFHFEIYFAAALDEVPVANDNNLQDKGIQFLAAYTTYF